MQTRPILWQSAKTLQRPASALPLVPAAQLQSAVMSRTLQWKSEICMLTGTCAANWLPVELLVELLFALLCQRRHSALICSWVCHLLMLRIKGIKRKAA